MHKEYSQMINNIENDVFCHEIHDRMTDMLYGQKITGAQLKEYFDGPFYKLTTKNGLHEHANPEHTYQYKSGWNVVKQFKHKGSCSPYGFYITDQLHLSMWLEYTVTSVYHKQRKEFTREMYWCYPLDIADDTQVYVERDKFKVDKVYLDYNKRMKVGAFDPLFHRLMLKGYVPYPLPVRVRHQLYQTRDKDIPDTMISISNYIA